MPRNEDKYCASWVIRGQHAYPAASLYIMTHEQKFTYVEKLQMHVRRILAFF